MNGESRSMHQRAAVVAIIGIVLGTLSQASLVDSAMRTQPRASRTLVSLLCVLSRPTMRALTRRGDSASR
jgi:hypothetical protein